MNKKTRFLASILAVVMLVRYSEVGMLAANAADSGQVYQSENMSWYSMIGEDIQLYYGTFYQSGIHSTDIEVLWEEDIQGMLYDRGEFMNLYDAYGENTKVEIDVYSNSNLFINSSDIFISGITGARLSHKINGDRFELTKNGVLYAAGDEITINASDIKIAGLIYAPGGTVTINADTVELSGLIAAKNIIINAGIIKEHPDRDLKAVYDEVQVEFYPEVLVTPIEEGQIKIYGGNINIKSMEIYTRENYSEEFQKVYEAEGNEYIFFLPETVQAADIRVKCTNIFGHEELSNIESLVRTEEGIQNTTIDSDEDGLPDGYEIWDLKTDPQNSDSDRDGLPDGYEVLYSHTDPLIFDSSTDSDGDGLTALEEYERGTNPLYADTDFDGIRDKEDLEPLTTTILADQSDYQNCGFEPEMGFYDHKKVYIDINGNRQVQIFNRITKEEYYDDNSGIEFLRVKDAENQTETIIFSDGEEADIETYEYDNEGRKTTWAVNGDVYQYEYDDEKGTADTYLNNSFYSRISYDDNDNAVKMEYANEDVIDYEYDENSLLRSVSLNGERTFEYQYEGENLVMVEDFLNDTSYEMIYDDENNLTGYKSTDGLEKQISYTEETDTYTENYRYEGEERIVTLYTTETEEGMLLHAELPNGVELVTESGKAKVARYLTEAGSSIFLDEKNADENSLVTSLTNLLGTYEYEYDMNGNLETVYKDGNKIYHYIYDKNQQMIQYYDYEAGIVSKYSYDSNYNLLKSVTSDLFGNIIEEKIYGYREDTTLGLQQYAGKDIVYDESGNPIIYYNGWELAWSNGRMLESITDRENVVSYSYNKDGIRIGKTVNGINIEYLLDENNQMVGEKCGEEILWYLYDSGNEISGFEWNEIDYYYVKNAAGDVQGITDKTGNVLCTYYYDVWGKLIEITGDEELGRRNPIRYRGYYYDEETGLYYLNTRYYDPEVKRFLNRDMLDNETNLYQYCYNNPVMNADYNGMSAYDVDDSSLSVVNTAYGRKMCIIGTGCCYKYITSRLESKVEFNCYLWALGQYVIDYNPNIKAGTPGTRSGHTKWSASTIYELRDLVVDDLEALKYKVYSITSSYPSIKSGYKAMAVRSISQNNADYHFFKLESASTGIWSFKAGWSGCVFKLNFGYKPNQISWYCYEYKDNIWKHTLPQYKSTIYYVVYK